MTENAKVSDLKDDDFLFSHGVDLFTASDSAMQLFRQRMIKDNDLYDARFTTGERKFSDYLGTQRLFIPKTYSYIQRILVEVMETVFFDSEEIADVGSGNKRIPALSKAVVKAVINHRLNCHPIDGYKEFYEAALDAIRNKICVMKIYPQLKTEYKKTKYDLPDLDTGETIQLEREEEIINGYAPYMCTVPPEDVYFHPFATWKDYHQYPIVHRYRRNRDYLKKLGYKNVDNIAAVKDLAFGDEIKSNRLWDTQSPFSENTIKQQEEIYCYEIWSHLPDKDGDLESGSFILIGDQSGPQKVARGWEPNRLPYKFSEFEYNRPPFIMGVAFPESHKKEGKSFPEITEALQQETNAQRNQEREAVVRALRPTTFVSRDSNVDLASLLQRRIGGYVQVDGPANAAAYEMQTMNPSFITAQHQARTDNDYFETSGIPPNLLGISSREETATASTQQLSNANKKMSLIIRNLVYTVYIPSITYLLRLEQTYESDAYIRMVTGETLGWELPNDGTPANVVIEGDFDLKINMGMNKQNQINKMMLLADRINQTNAGLSQLVQLGVVNPQSVSFVNPMLPFEQILPILGYKNIEEWKLQALPPQVNPADVPGIASQPKNIADAGSAISNISQEAPAALNVA